MDTSIEFDGVLTQTCTRYLISSFMKYVLYQRGQIPFQFESLMKYGTAPVEKVDSVPSISDEVLEKDWSGADGVRHHQQMLREKLIQARHTRRKLRNDEKLRKRIQLFLTAYDQCDQQLSAALDSCSWDSGLQVALLLGSSTISPKEVYVLHFPPIAPQFDRHPRCLQHRRGAVQLFRTLVTCSPLLELTARQLAPTNVHVLVHTAPGGDALVPRPEQTFRRGTVIHIRLQHGARALAEPTTEPVPVSPCCGRVAPRRLQPCCAAYASEMGLSLLDASLSPMPAAARGRASVSARHSPPQSSCMSRSPTCSSSSLRSSVVAADEASDAGPAQWPLEGDSDGEPEELESIWCQIPVKLRGFRTPAASVPTSGDWLATTE